jgi:hypothetical protein
MAISTILALLFGLVTAFFAAVYCFKPDMIVRQVNETARRTPKLLHFTSYSAAGRPHHSPTGS